MRERILVTQTGGWIGDMILLTPALRALKCAYPTAHLALMLRPLVAELMSTHPYLDEVIIDTKDSHGRWFANLRRMVGCVRDLNFDLAIVLHPTSFRNAPGVICARFAIPPILSVIV